MLKYSGTHMRILSQIRKMALLVGALSIILTPALYAAQAHAEGEQEGVGITISPAVVDKEIEAGKSHDDKITVLNRGTVNFDYKVYASGFTVDGEDYNPTYQGTENADASKWFSFSGETNGTLKSGDMKEIPVSINVPAGTAGGSYYAVVFAETVPDQAQSTGVSTQKRVGTVFYITVPGEVSRKGDVATWDVKSLQKEPLTALLRLSNDGSVYYRADVKVSVTDIFGKEKFKYSADPAVVPGKTRRTQIEWKDGASFGLFKVGGEVKINGETKKLATKYVLVASTPMRIALVGLLFVFLVSLVAVFRGSRDRGARQ